jgi:restriction system protein
MVKEWAKSKLVAKKTLFAAFSILEKNNKEMPIKKLMEAVEKSVEFSDWDRERLPKTGYIRWQSIFHLYSIDCVKATYIVKKNGIWYLTDMGIAAAKDGEDTLFENFTTAYKKWALENKKSAQVVSDDNTVDEVIENNDDIIFDDLQEKSIESMVNFINKKNAYEFQDLVAALLRGMGYFTPFIAPKGKDGGLDIIAYKDPLGTSAPRIQVQVKHRESTASVQEIRELMGLLQREGDVGLFVSTGGFTSDAKNAARGSTVHIELIDQNKFIELWQEFYDKLSDQDKNRFPLRSIYLLDIDT